MFNRKSIHIVLFSLLILAVVVTPALAGSGIATLISWGEDGGKTKNGDSFIHSLPATSADGRYVVFSSTATNVVQNDTNGKMDVFVRDRQTNTNIRVSVDSIGAQANNNSSSASISAEGRYVAFWSDASNLVGGDTNGLRDVIVRDRVTGANELASVASDGDQGNGDSWWYPSISADGRYV
ncbi:MAG: hypothetical protein HGA86_02735, partial [Anaerolineaceae bacterium]|nr:hypothetical protein [Anaerolineaceae bacterium]